MSRQMAEEQERREEEDQRRREWKAWKEKEAEKQRSEREYQERHNLDLYQQAHDPQGGRDALSTM